MTTKRKGVDMTDIINFLATRLELAIAQGQGPDQARQTAVVETQARYRGERVYIAGRDAERRLKIQAAESQVRTVRELAVKTGIPVRTLQRRIYGK